ncbi:phage tail assembly protein [Immundisolibacter sp.]|uniref:phage tail assembly protein n=1 Tax=Immundisolibacter sp. TaxID=1934948 RepID=UPI002621490B|nr:phage tail assembly protein [Immundisolibacter sp.]MDD3652399.1 phage tail assembly protein [Immundisolibacter sp.]
MPNPITLEQPIQRGDTTIATLELRKPCAGELRGIKIIDLMQMDADALIKVIPRISNPTLTDHEAARIDPADLLQIGAEVVGFFLTTSDRAQSHYPGA